MNECQACWPHPDHGGDCFPHCTPCREEEEELRSIYLNPQTDQLTGETIRAT